LTATPAPRTPLTVDQFVDVNRITKDVAINGVDLRGELERQPGLVYFYTSMTAKAERQYARLKLRLEATEAQVATNVRTDAAIRVDDATGLADPERLTAPQVVERVRLHPKVVAVEVALIDAKEVETVLKGVVQALRDKSQALTSLTNMTRDEIRAKLQVEADLQEKAARPKGHLASLRHD
jgi:hypothetical protein